MRRGGALHPFRQRDGVVNQERAFADQQNFVTDPSGVDIPGNRGRSRPHADDLHWQET